MAVPESKTISSLDLANPLTDADMFPVVQQGRTKRATFDQIKAGSEDACQCTLVSRYNVVGTPNNSLLNYLQTYTLPAGIMSVDGNYLEVHAAGYFAANANNKLVSIGIKQNSTGHNQKFSIPLFGYNDDYWLIDLRIQRSSETTYAAYQYVSVTGNNVTLQTPGVLHSIGDVSGVDWSLGDVQITVEGTTTGIVNDITCGTFIVEAHLLDPNS